MMAMHFLISHCKMGLDVHKKLSYYSITVQQKRWGAPQLLLLE